VRRGKGLAHPRAPWGRGVPLLGEVAQVEGRSPGEGNSPVGELPSGGTPPAGENSPLEGHSPTVEIAWGGARTEGIPRRRWLHGGVSSGGGVLTRGVWVAVVVR